MTVDFSPFFDATPTSPTISIKSRNLGDTLPGVLPGPTDESTYGLVNGPTLQGLDLWTGTLPTEFKADAAGILMGRDGGGYTTAVRRIALYDPNFVVPEPSSLALWLPACSACWPTPGRSASNFD